MITEELNKQALGSFPSGVTVVTAYDENGQVTGVTASAFSALSMDPALVLVCPNYESDSYPVLREASRFAINILAADQTSPCFAFAKKGEAKTAAIAEVAITKSEFGTPLIDGAVATIECSLWKEYEGGDHAILIGKMEQASVNDDASPMVYCRGKMADWAAIAE